MQSPEDKNLQILSLIAEVRKFEIELFWSRSLFFWGFTALAITAFGAAYHLHSKNLQFSIACVGFVCSLIWTLVNRSSKYWQKTWEEKAKRASLEAVGRNLFMELPREPLCKGIREVPWWAAHFSVSKLTTAFSDFTALVWLGLGLKSSPAGQYIPSEWVIPSVFVCTLVYIIYIFVMCLPDPPEKK